MANRHVIHGAAEARAVLATARAPVVLVSPAAAAASHGIGWWLELTALLRRDCPERLGAMVLDCGHAPGLALAALRAGVRQVRIGTDPATLARLRQIAAALDAAVEEGPTDDVR